MPVPDHVNSQPRIIPLGACYALYVPLGLVVNTETKRVVDAHSFVVRSTCGSLLDKHKEDLSFIYSPGSLSDKGPNCLDATKHHRELSALLSPSTFYMCGACKNFCTARPSSSSYLKHIQVSGKCAHSSEPEAIVSGYHFMDTNRKAVFIVIDKHPSLSNGSGNGTHKTHKKRNRSTMEEEEEKEKEKEQEQELDVQNNFDSPIEEHDDMEEVDTAIEEMVSEVHRFIEVFCKDNANLEGYDPQNMQLRQTCDEYFLNPLANATLLPYVLLDCITDDLWNSDESVRDTFRFLLRPTGPELVVFDKLSKVEVRLRLTNNGLDLWSACVSMRTLTKPPSRFQRSDQLDFADVSYPEICDVLVTFRGVANILLNRIHNEVFVPEMAQLTDFVAKCFEDLSCGVELAEKLIRNQLLYHIGRTTAD